MIFLSIPIADLIIIEIRGSRYKIQVDRPENEHLMQGQMSQLNVRRHCSRMCSESMLLVKVSHGCARPTFLKHVISRRVDFSRLKLISFRNPNHTFPVQERKKNPPIA